MNVIEYAKLPPELSKSLIENDGNDYNGAIGNPRDDDDVYDRNEKAIEQADLGKDALIAGNVKIDRILRYYVG